MKKKLFLTCVIVSVIFSSINAVAIDAPNNIKYKLTKTRKDMEHLHSNLLENTQKNQHLMHELRQSEEEIGAVSKILYHITTTLQQEKKLYKELHTKFIATKAKYKTNQEVLAKQMQLTHNLGNMPQIKLLLGNYDPNNITRMLVYYGYIYTHQQQKLTTSTAMLQDIQALQTAMQQKIAAISSKQTEKSNQIEKLKKTNAMRAALLVEINQTINKDSKTLALLQRDEKLLERKISQLQSQALKPLANRNTVASGNQNISANKTFLHNLSLHKPIISEATKVKMHAISSANSNRFLIQAPPGSKVYAIQNGRVVFANWLRGYGLLLIIEHNNDLMSLYGHNQTLFKKVGDTVNKGEPIALVGQSGGQMLPGLYFEIRKAAKSINVRDWFNYETT